MRLADLTGNLRTMKVADVLQWLANGQATGTLVVDNGIVEKQIYFRVGHIIAAGSSDPLEYLGHFLVSHGYITEDQLTAGMAQQEKTHVLLGKILVDAGFISVGDLEHMLQLKSREGIYELFTWRDGEFRFIEGQLPAYEMVPISIGVTGIVLEAMQRLDEWADIRKTIPSPDAVPVTLREPFDVSSLPEDVRAVAAAINDNRTVAEICLHTHSSEYFVAKILQGLAGDGAIKVVRPRSARTAEVVGATDPPTLMAHAWKHFKAGDYRRALRHGRAAATLEPDNAVVRKHLASLETALRETLEAEGVKPDRIPRLLVKPEQLTALPLSPEEGFILTRIDGVSPVGAILKITPIPPIDVILVFYRLMTAGHISLEKPR